jgi:prepilin-type N-terminal cleavage/methylation domain-containing protein
MKRYLKNTCYDSFGFTLLEIMIALAIIGITLTIVIHTVNYHANVLYENILTTEMYQAAKEKMFELETDPVESKGKIDETGLQYESTVNGVEGTGLVELKTIIYGKGKRITLSELVTR